MPKYNISLDQERQLAYDRLKKICDTGFLKIINRMKIFRQKSSFFFKGLFSVKDFWTNPRNIFAAHEITGMVDPSTTTKLTVQFNLFGGTLLKLGTKHHHQMLDSIDK